MNIFKHKSKEKLENSEDLKDSQRGVQAKPENWIWVDGYKDTDNHMRGYGGFQFELNKRYDCKGEIVLGVNGFHFCKDVKDISCFYNLPDSRIFKVKALYDANKKYDKQFAAKSIILTEELDTPTIWNLFSDELLLPKTIDCNNRRYQIQFVNSYDDFKKIREIGYQNFKRNQMIAKWKALGFSDSFITIFIINHNFDSYTNDVYNIVNYSTAKALVDEGLSKDMIVYFLLRNSKDI